ncbi:MAG TPA: thioredoxin fold domain-containing protein [Casimicrobiaceae bacterium]|nr:thioredoxin fold domain-containing protein [Casimicrobiaceae bacterium]
MASRCASSSKRRLLSGLAAGFACAVTHEALAVSDDSIERENRARFVRLAKSDVVIEGPREARRILYVFFDPNCLYCHLTWKALQPYEKAGLQVRLVPVAYQQPSSAGRAAAIMQAHDRVAAMRENELRYDRAHFDGGIAPANVSKALAAQLDANTRLMRAFGAPGTPLLVWKDSEGRIQVMNAAPRLSALPRITGIEAQPENDPELAQLR